MNDYERVGGAQGVSRIVGEFVSRVHSDFIIGFFFEGRDLNRILRRDRARQPIARG